MRNSFLKNIYLILGGAVIVAASITFTVLSGYDGDKNGANTKIGAIQQKPESFKVKPIDSLADIKAAYQDGFSELAIWQGSTIDQIIVQAKADYVSGLYTKESLLAKYQELALTLEAQADEFFEAIYLDLENELERNGYPLSEAEVFRKEYERKKAERLQQVVDKLSDF